MTKQENSSTFYLSKRHDGWPSSVRTSLLFSAESFYTLLLFSTYPTISW